MKKLLTVLCVAAFGIGAAAQAQVLHPSVRRFNETVVHKLQGDEAMQMPTAKLAQASGERGVYDTILWGPEYTTEDCYLGSYYVRWGRGDSYFEGDVFPHAAGMSFNGTGEVGVTFRTKNNAYFDYTGLSLSNYYVVGAYTMLYRGGSSALWDREGRREGLGANWPEYNGVPDVKAVMKAYPTVVQQPAVDDYVALIEEGKANMIQMYMPVNTQEFVQTDTLLIHYLGPTEQRPDLPVGQRMGGLFKDGKFIEAGNDYAIALKGIFRNDAKYDSVWNYGTFMKDPGVCILNDMRVAWSLVDYSHPEGMNMWRGNDGILDVKAPFEEGGFMPENSPQAEYPDNEGLFVFAYGQGLSTGGDLYLPTIYGIALEKTQYNNEKNTYAQTVSVYPMPATDKVNIVALDPIRRVEIYNMAGALLKSVTMNDNVLEFDVTSYTPGTYVARITTDKGVASKKLLVK